VFDGDAVCRFIKFGQKLGTEAYITIAIRLRYDYDSTTTYRVRLLPLDAMK